MAVQILLGHTKIENTVRYLGVDIVNALEKAGIQFLSAGDNHGEGVRFRNPS